MIREAKIEDVDSISNIILSSWQNAFFNIIDTDFPKSLDINNYKKIFSENIQYNKEKIFVYDDGTVKGFISGKVCNGKYDCEVVGLYVHPNFKRQGIGNSLLLVMRQYFKEQGHQKLIIWTLKGAYNNGFYTKQHGIALEQKNLTFGQKSYQGVGFIFDLS